MTKTLRVLVADDDEGLRMLMRLILRQAGFEVIEAVDGQEALARIQDCQPTLILLDMMMPGLDGLTVCRNLKDDQRFNQVPVIFVTATDDLPHRLASQELGADDYIRKPIGPRELVTRIRQVLDRRGVMYTV